MVERHEFLDEIHRNPGDHHLRHVYADWLEEHGDARAEYVRLEVERSGLSLDDDPAGRLGEICERMMQLRGTIDERWLAEIEQPGVMIGNPTPYEPRWWAFGINGHRDIDSTYSRLPYESLPPLDLERWHTRRGYNWLDERTEPLTADDVEYHGELRAQLSARQRCAADLGIEIPADLRTLVECLDSRRLIASCTGCYLEAELEDELLMCPHLPSVRLVPFYHDSQGCLVWYAAIHPSGGHCVLCSPVLELLYPEDMEGLTPEQRERAYRTLVYVAPSVESFLYRIKLENDLWTYGAYEQWEQRAEPGSPTPSYLPPEKPELTVEQRAYLDGLGAAEP